MLSIPMLKHNFKACIVPFFIIFAFLTMYTTVIIYMYDPKLAEMLEGYQEAFYYNAAFISVYLAFYFDGLCNCCGDCVGKYALSG